MEVYLTAETGPFRQLRQFVKITLVAENVSMCKFKRLCSGNPQMSSYMWISDMHGKNAWRMFDPAQHYRLLDDEIKMGCAGVLKRAQLGVQFANGKVSNC